jgi:hypothetical protein
MVGGDAIEFDLEDYHWGRGKAEVLVTFIIAGVAGLFTYLIAYGRRGALWGTTAYVIGLIVGVAVTLVWTVAMESETHQISDIIGFGFVGAIFGRWAGFTYSRRQAAKGAIRDK